MPTELHILSCDFCQEISCDGAQRSWIVFCFTILHQTSWKPLDAFSGRMTSWLESLRQDAIHSTCQDTDSEARIQRYSRIIVASSYAVDCLCYVKTSIFVILFYVVYDIDIDITCYIDTLLLKLIAALNRTVCAWSRLFLSTSNLRNSLIPYKTLTWQELARYGMQGCSFSSHAWYVLVDKWKQ
jgi:hypothetical protein